MASPEERASSFRRLLRLLAYARPYAWVVALAVVFSLLYAGGLTGRAYLVKPPNAEEIERAITIAIARFDDLMELRRLNAELEADNEAREKLILELEDTLAQVKTLSGFFLYALPAKRYAMTKATGINSRSIFETILKWNSAMAFVPNVRKNFTQRFSGMMNKMKPRERVFVALEHREPDRVPRFEIWIDDWHGDSLCGVLPRL